MSFDVHAGQIFGIVGESGCGKSVTVKSILRIVEDPGKIVQRPDPAAPASARMERAATRS